MLTQGRLINCKMEGGLKGVNKSSWIAFAGAYWRITLHYLFIIFGSSSWKGRGVMKFHAMHSAFVQYGVNIQANAKSMRYAPNP